MILQTVLYWLSIAVIVLTGSVVLLTRKKPVFVYYSLFSFTLVAWLICQYFIDRDVHTLLWLGISFISLELIVPTFVLFVNSFPDGPSLGRRPTLLLFVPLLLFGPFSFSSLLARSTTLDTAQTFVFGPLYWPQTVVVLIYLLIGLSLLPIRYKKMGHLEQSQIVLFFVAFMPFLVASLLTGAFFANNSQIQFLRPLSALFMTVTIIYSIIRHRLFDIRLVVARSMGYVVSVTVLAAAYGLIVFSIANYVFGLHIPLTDQIFLSFATGLAGLLFQRPIKLFDKATNKFFYRDAYDVQELFGGLNKTLVSSLNLDYLLKHVSAILMNNLKSESALFVIKGGEDGQYRVIGTAQPNYDRQNIARVHSLMSSVHQGILVADLMDEKQASLKQAMEHNNIAVLVQLLPDVKKTDKGLGHIILGPKKSGNPYTSQDIRVLDTVANELIIAIQNSLHFEEIQRFNVTLQGKIEDATRQLRRTNAKLEALDEIKDDFISMASHQLRTPLTSVKGYLSMVLEGDAGKIDEMQRKMLNQAFISSQRMVYLIADLLNVSRLKTGKFVIDAVPVDLSTTITEEVSQLIETAASRGIELTYHKPTNFPQLMFDETKTRQVIMNFIDNAIYYTPSGGHITVKLEDKAATIELKVVDNGIGVPAAEQHHLFTKFYRARNAQKARPDGTGLGLFMAKKVVVAQGGAILFESKEGQGSTFGFVFSKSKLQPPEAIIIALAKPKTLVKK
jgi:signal transduction histidine kinase